MCLLCVRERDGMMWHWATDIVIHQPSFQVRLERLYGAALASTLPQVQIDSGFFSVFLRKEGEKSAAAHISAPGQCSPSMCPALSAFPSFSPCLTFSFH